MNLLELQKIDFFLKKANNYNHNTNNHRIVFGMNGNVYTGDFIPAINDSKVVLPNVLKFESDATKEIGLKNETEWEKIAGSSNVSFEFSDFYKLISRSFHNDQTYYLQLVIELFKKYPIEFEETLPNYIYNVKSFSSNPSIDLPIIHVDQNTQFNFISLIPEK